jgi:hypothetical protein
MLRRIAPLVPALLLVIGCAGPAKLTQRSGEKLAQGDVWKAWQLATRALDKSPGNPQAREAATAAGAAIAQDWERRIHALADLDSVRAAEQVLEFAEFRANAAHYATIPVGATWPGEELALRSTAAHIHYVNGTEAMAAKRPKRAWGEFHETERFVPGYRDAAKLADKAFNRGLTRVALVPFRASSDHVDLAAQVAENWRGDLVQQLGKSASFTRMMGGDEIDRTMTVSQLGYVSRDDAVRLGRKAGAQRVVWGSIGEVKSQTRLQLFKDVVARRITLQDSEGHSVTRWVDVPIEVVARIRDVTVPVEYEVISTTDGASLTHQRLERSQSARVVWTSYQPEGEIGSYSLVSETARSANPDRCRDIETRWKTVCGDGVTLAQVLEARRNTRDDGRYRHDSLPRFIAGAAFVFLTDLPPAEDLAFAALARSSSLLRDDLMRLDAVDDVDLGVTVTSSDSR